MILETRGLAPPVDGSFLFAGVVLMPADRRREPRLDLGHAIGGNRGTRIVRGYASQQGEPPCWALGCVIGMLEARARFSEGMPEVQFATQDRASAWIARTFHSL
jgi:hypothetical protein